MSEDRDYKTLIQVKREKEAQKGAKYKVDSKERLGKIATKKIKTTMIGALDAIERHFGFLWEPDDNGEVSEEALHMKEVYEKTREEILDNGNNQMRNLLSELEQYDVEWLRYRYNIPIIQRKKDNQDGSE